MLDRNSGPSPMVTHSQDGEKKVNENREDIVGSFQQISSVVMDS